jgi:hypothetical protein
MAQVVECLLCKSETGSNLNPAKKFLKKISQNTGM